jgi:hypothetical protein
MAVIGGGEYRGKSYGHEHFKDAVDFLGKLN